MTWFPTFLSPWIAAIAAAVAIPSLLILYFLKLRRREMPVSSTLLWKKAIQDLQVNSPFQKLRKNLLLLLQMLLVILLLLALARPIVSYKPPAGKVTVLLIDNSASMSATDMEGGRSRLDEAKRRAKDQITGLDRKAMANVIVFNDEVGTRVVEPFTSDVTALKRAIDSIQTTDRQTRAKVAYQLAEAQTAAIVENSSGEKPDVFVYSDGRVLDADALSVRGTIHFDKIGTDTAKNIGIVSLSAKRNYERPTEVQIFMRLANFGTVVENADVQISVDGEVKSVPATTLLPERFTEAQRQEALAAGVQERSSVEFTIDLETSAVIKAEQMNKENDVLPADDVAQVVVPPPRSMRVLLVTEGNYFLERSLESMKLENYTTRTPSAYEAQVPGEFDVIIFDRHSPKKLPPSGSYLYFGALPPDSKIKQGIDALDQPARITDTGVLDWKRDHPILRDLALGKLYIADALKLDVPLESETLMEGMKGPLIALHRDGRAVHMVVAFDVLQSNWPLRPSFPMFMYYTLQFFAAGADLDVRQYFTPGASPRIQRVNLQQADPNLKELRIIGPDSTKTLTIPETGDIALPALEKVGLYKLDPPIPNYEQIAVNLLDDNESNLVPTERPPGGIGEVLVAGEGKSRLELWWWLVAFGAIPLLLIEWWVYTRRVHL